MSASLTAAIGNFAAGVSTLTEAVRAAAQSPRDQVRLLSQLAVYQPVVTSSTAPIGAAIAEAQTATAAILRRTALASLALACADYQPYSSQDALTLRDNVVALFDAEIIVAADAGDTNSYEGLRELRTAVVTDLTDRAAQLPAQRTVTTPEPEPSLALAYRLYADASRSDDLIARVDPIHPAFMPVEFTALSS